MKVRASLATSNMCCSRTRSSFRILDTCCGEYFVAEIAAKLVGSAQIDLSTFKKRRKFPLHPSQIKETGGLVRMELNQQVDVAILPQLTLQSRTEEGEFPYAISLAKIGDLSTRELNTGFLVHLGTLLLRSSRELFLVSILPKGVSHLSYIIISPACRTVPAVRPFIRNLEKQQIRRLLRVCPERSRRLIAVTHPIVSEDVKVVPEFLDDR